MSEHDGIDPESNGDPEDGPPNAADPVDQKRQRRKVQRLTDQSREFWRGVLSTPEGRQEIWSLLSAAHTFEERFTTSMGLPNAQYTWFEAGQQAFGLRLYQTLLLADLDHVKQMHEDFDQRYPKPKTRRGNA